jgi:hypothetical protein
MQDREGRRPQTWREMHDRLRQVEAQAQVAEQQLQQALALLDAPQRVALSGALTDVHPLLTPPEGLDATVQAVAATHPHDTYAFPLGWITRSGTPTLITASLYGDSPHKSGHVLVTGETDWGKDGWAHLLALTLCSRTTPAQFQLFWIDGKGPDGALWRGRAHNWKAPVTRTGDIRAAIQIATAERERRAHLLQQQGVTKWEELAVDVRPPLLWVYVSELKLLRRFLGRDLEIWLEAELSSARACGIRYGIATQTVTNMRTEWRSQIGLCVAGAQTSRDGDKPNLGIGTDEIRERGGIPPSVLDQPGMFTVRNRRTVFTVRAPYLSLEERKAALAALPAEPLQPDSTRPPDTAQQSLTQEQQQRIRELLDLGKSDGQIVADIFQVRGGRRYRPLQQQVAAVRAQVQRSSTIATGTAPRHSINQEPGI